MRLLGPDNDPTHVTGETSGPGQCPDVGALARPVNFSDMNNPTQPNQWIELVGL